MPKYDLYHTGYVTSSGSTTASGGSSGSTNGKVEIIVDGAARLLLITPALPKPIMCHNINESGKHLTQDGKTSYENGRV